MNTIPSIEWLESAHSDLARDGVHPNKRVLELVAKYQRDFQIDTFAFNSPEFERIHDFVKSNSRPGAMSIGELYTGAFFFEGQFWTVGVPVFYGRVRLDPWERLKNMPPGVRTRLVEDAVARSGYIRTWRDCLSIGLGKHWSKSRFFSSGRDHLRDAAQLLLEGSRAPSQKAWERSRFAIECHLKGLIDATRTLPEQEAKRISHDLEAALIAAEEATGIPELTRYKGSLKALPRVDQRYSDEAVSTTELWTAQRLAQEIAAIVASHFDRGSNPQS